MYDGATAPSELSHEGQSDDALAAARTTRHQHDALVVTSPRLLHLMKHEVKRQSLLVKQHELLTTLDLISRHPEQLLARGAGGIDQVIRVWSSSNVTVEVRLQEAQPLATVGGQEEAGVLILWEVVEVLDCDRSAALCR